jgi:RNA polymerase sigma-70 factor (ECF subfamily)
MSSRSEVVEAMPAAETPFDFEATFRAQYARIARVIARVVRDSARAEELAVEVFLKFWRCPEAHGEKAEGWLYRTAVRKGLDELRSQTRRARYERLFGFASPVRNPEQLHAASEEQDRVRNVLTVIGSRHAELLLLRSNELSYEELAAALRLNPSSVGKLLSRAQDAFRKEYVNRYGKG